MADKKLQRAIARAKPRYVGTLRAEKLRLPLLMMLGWGPPGLVLVDADTLRFRFGPWVRLDAPLRDIIDVRVVDNGEPVTKGKRALQLSSGPYERVRIVFRDLQRVEWLIKISRKGLIGNSVDLVDVLDITPSDPAGLVKALQPARARKPQRPKTRASRATKTKQRATAPKGSRGRPSGRGTRGSSSRRASRRA